MSYNHFIIFIQQIAFALTLIFISSQFAYLFNKHSIKVQQLFVGIVIALVITLTTLANEQVHTDESMILFLDLRIIILSLLGFITGTISTFIATTIIAIFYMFESDFTTSILSLSVIIVSAIIGVIGHNYIKKDISRLNWKGFFLINLMSNLYYFITITLFNSETLTETPFILLILLFIIYPCCSILLGYLLVPPLTSFKLAGIKSSILQYEFEHTSIGLSIADKNFKRVFVTKSYCETFGYTEEEMLSINWKDLYPPEENKREEPLFNKLINGEISHYSIQKKMIRKDGSSGFVQNNVVSKEVYKGITYTAAIIIDLSNLQKESLEIEENEKQLNNILEHTSIATIEIDLQNNIVTHNQVVSNLLGIEADDPDVLNQWINAMHPNCRVSYLDNFTQCIKGDKDSFELECSLNTIDKGYRWFKTYARIIKYDSQHKPIQLSSVSYDNTEQHKQIEQLHIFASIYESSTEAMMVLDQQFNIISINQAFSILTELTEAQALKESIDILPLQNDSNSFFNRIINRLKNTNHWSGEIILELKNGDLKFAWMSLNTVFKKDKFDRPTSSVAYYLALFIDISKRKNAEHAIWYQAHYDTLTGLPNRSYFLEEIDHALLYAENFKQRNALLFIDLDQFNHLNELLGLYHGDNLIITIAKRLQSNMKNNNFVAHLGDDEFVILLLDMPNNKEIQNRVEEILLLISAPIELIIDKTDDSILNNHFSITASIGISCFPDDARNRSDLMKHADQAMYVAKGNGGNGYHFFTSEMQHQTEDQLELLQNLKDALTQNQFTLYYQPIMDLNHHDAFDLKVEVLIRWQHPTKGLINAATFIKLAEESGIICDIGRWIFEQSCLQLLHWNKQGIKAQLSMNLSVLQFKDQTFNIDQWLIRLEELDLSPNQFIFELTEDVLLNDTEIAIALLNRYRKAGFKIALDDFGTGYSSLSYMKRFIVDYVKIDSSFIHNIDTNLEYLAICKTIISLVQKLNINVIAEGVETKAQFELLENLKCCYIQGRYVKEPLPLNDFEIYLDSIK